MEFAAGKLTLSEEDFQRAIDEMPEQLRVRRVMRAYAVVVILAGLGGGLVQERVAQIIPKRAFDAAQLEHIRQWLSAGVQEGPPAKNVLRIFVIWTVLVVSFLLVWQLLVTAG